MGSNTYKRTSESAIGCSASNSREAFKKSMNHYAVENLFGIEGLNIAWYGIIITFGMILGFMLGCILPTPNAPGQRVFLRCAASFFLAIRQDSCEKMSCSTQKSLAAGHIMSFQIHPKRKAAEMRLFQGTTVSDI